MQRLCKSEAQTAWFTSWKYVHIKTVEIAPAIRILLMWAAHIYLHVNGAQSHYFTEHTERAYTFTFKFTYIIGISNVDVVSVIQKWAIFPLNGREHNEWRFFLVFTSKNRFGRTVSVSYYLSNQLVSWHIVRFEIDAPSSSNDNRAKFLFSKTWKKNQCSQLLHDVCSVAFDRQKCHNHWKRKMTFYV